jgi:hypothetical protein
LLPFTIEFCYVRPDLTAYPQGCLFQSHGPATCLTGDNETTIRVIDVENTEHVQRFLNRAQTLAAE